MWTVDTSSKGGESFPSKCPIYIIQADSRILQVQRRNASDWVEARKVVRCSLPVRPLDGGSYLIHVSSLLRLP